MKKDQALNKFTKGLLLDMNPMSVASDTLVDCLNGTLITYNGNEYVLLNDMGNARVETATLPPGYIPLGGTSFGGIIYIVSHNPLENKYLIGSFPSPERNLSKDELGGNEISVTIDFNYESLWKNNLESDCPEIRSSLNQIILCDKELHSGDKFKVFSNNIAGLLQADVISGFLEGNTDVNLYPKYLRIDLISILSNGSVIKLTDNLTWTNFETETVSGNYYIYPGEIKLNDDNSSSLEEYRNLVLSQYDVYTEKYPGQLGLLCSYEAPSSFNVGYDAIISKDEKNNISTAQFYYYLNWTNENTGIHKNRVNPYLMLVYLDSNTDTGTITNIIDIELPVYTIEWINKFELLIKIDWNCSDTLNNIDYHSTTLPDDFYKDNFDIEEYLKKWDDHKFLLVSDKLRKNDGSDPLIVIKGPAIQYTINNGKVQDVKYNNLDISIDDDKFLNLKVTPIMPYGKLNYLTQDLKINLAQLGTGTIDLVLYKYFIDDLKATIDFLFETYLELNKRIKSIDLKIYTLPNNPLETSETTYTDIKSADWGKPVYEKNIVQQSYNTLTQHKIYFNDSFEKDNIYQLEIVVHYAEEDRYYYRILHTTPIFNNKYYGENDFSNLWLYPGKNEGYGIKPTLKITPTLTGSLTTDSINLEDIDMFQMYSGTLEKSLTYEATINPISSMGVSIISGYDNIPLKLDDSVMSVDVNIESSYSNIGNGEIDISPKLLYSTPIKLEINSIEGLFASEYLEFPKLNYNIELKGLVYYTNIQSVYPYSLTMVDVSYTTPIKINLWAKEKKYGNLKLYINDNIEYLLNIPEDHHIEVNVDDILRILRKYCDINKLDVVTVRIGIEKFNDDLCATLIYGNNEVGTKENGNPEYFIFGKALPEKPENIFTNYLFVRSGSTGMLLGTCKDYIGNDGNYKSENIQNGYFGSPVGNEATSNSYQDGFTYNSEHCFKKYVKQLEPISIYTIEETTIPENPTIDFNITFTANNNNNNLCCFDKYTYDSEYTIKNLSFKENSYILDSNVHKVTIFINNKSLLNSLLYEKIYNITSNGDKITDETLIETKGIYNLNNVLFSGKIDSNGLLLIDKPNYDTENIIKDKNTQFHLLFNWENANHNNDWGGDDAQGIKIKGFDVYMIQTINKNG